MFHRLRAYILLILLSFSFTACAAEKSATGNQENNSALEELPSTPPTAVDNPFDENPRETLTNPTNDKDFLKLANGKSLSSISVSGSSLYLVKGTGQNFTEKNKQDYLTLKNETLTDSNHKVQWAFMNLDTHTMIEESLLSNKKIFGASSSKIYVGATLLDKQSGTLSSSQLQLMSNMLVVSSNSAWTALQKEIGNGSADLGRELNWNFTQRMGYLQTRGFQGYWGKIHGNELVPAETMETLYDIYTNAFSGAETLWKLMHTCRTGTSRGKKYIPSNIYVGGKTGTYDGPTENPETGGNYNVKIRNHILIFNVNGVQYGLAIYANNGSDESVALLAGGLIREHTNIP